MQALESTHRQHEMEQLYTLSRNLLLLEVGGPMAQEITNLIARVFELPGAHSDDRTSDRIHLGVPGRKIFPWIPANCAIQPCKVLSFTMPLRRPQSFRSPSAARRWRSLGMQGSQVSDTAMHAISNLTAITLERARAQDVATRAEAARQSEELKSTMLDALAHEFKTPLTPIKAAVTSMLSDGSLGPTYQELLHIVDEETDRLNSMLTEAIQMSRIESGQLQLRRSPHSLHKIVETQLEKLRESTEGRKVTVDFPKSLPRVSVDPEFIGTAIWQLLTNALRYTPPGSPLTVRGSAGDTEVIVSVEDCGPGISEPEQRKIFERFYRGKHQRERIPGTGMGLTIAREIVRPPRPDLG